MGGERQFLTKQLVVNILLGLLCVLIFLSFPTLVHSHGHSHDEDHADHHHNSERPSFKYSREANQNPTVDHSPPKVAQDLSTVWLHALLSTVFISVVPFLILYFVPLDNSKEDDPFLKILLSFASGGLLGDAFLHLIPHALASHGEPQSESHGHGHSHGGGHDHNGPMGVGLSVLAGILVFLTVEKFVRLMKLGHSHSHGPTHDTTSAIKSDEKNKNDKTGDIASNAPSKSLKKSKETPVKTPEETHEDDVRVSAYLNLAADFTHNFTDGLAIGASYLAGQNVGIVTTITMLFHEIPHEIGDFAILIKSGCSRKKAMMLQLVTALGALSGTVFSLLAQGTDTTEVSWILPFTAGGFIYVATVTVIPELLVESKFWQSVKEIVALLVGVFMMALIAQYE